MAPRRVLLAVLLVALVCSSHARILLERDSDGELLDGKFAFKRPLKEKRAHVQRCPLDCCRCLGPSGQPLSRAPEHCWAETWRAGPGRGGQHCSIRRRSLPPQRRRGSTSVPPPAAERHCGLPVRRRKPDGSHGCLLWHGSSLFLVCLCLSFFQLQLQGREKAALNLPSQCTACASSALHFLARVRPTRLLHTPLCNQFRKP